MFTVCPKCALTLVVTAADLRVAQGYVRCGRCSNVFNALARLSEDRSSTPTAQTQTVPPASAQTAAPQPGQTITPPQQHAPAARQSALPHSPPQVSVPSQPSQPAHSSQAPPPESNPIQQKPPVAPRPTPPAPPPPPIEYDDDEIPEAALEFDPEATDVTQVFVQPPPDPAWTAITGSFKTIVLRSDDHSAEIALTPANSTPLPPPVPAAAKHSPPGRSTSAQAVTDTEQSKAEDESEDSDAATWPPTRAFQPTQLEADRDAEEAQVDIEIDAEFFASVTIDPKPTPAARSPFQAALQPAPPVHQPVSAPPPVELHTVQSTPPSHGVGSTGTTSTRLPKFEISDFDGVAATHAVAAIDARARARAAKSAASWSVGTGTLVIVLAAQIINHYRDDLAANAQLKRPITALYSMLGISLSPRWDLNAYDVRQLGASVDAVNAGQIRVRASVKNSAQQAQPMPLLRVTLQDQFGNRIAARDVPPQSYLPRAITPSAYLSSGQRIDAEMAFVDPGTNAVGFEIDACLPAPGGGIACASDTGAH